MLVRVCVCGCVCMCTRVYVCERVCVYTCTRRFDKYLSCLDCSEFVARERKATTLDREDRKCGKPVKRMRKIWQITGISVKRDPRCSRWRCIREKIETERSRSCLKASYNIYTISIDLYGISVIFLRFLSLSLGACSFSRFHSLSLSRAVTTIGICRATKVEVFTAYIRIQYIFIISLFMYVYYIHKMCFHRVLVYVYPCMSVRACVTRVLCLRVYPFSPNRL